QSPRQLIDATGFSHKLKEMSQKVDITTSTFIRFLLVLLGAWFLFLIRDVLVLLFLVLIIVSALSPVFDRWIKFITRQGAVVSVFLLFFIALGAIFGLLVPPLVTQLQEFTMNLPQYAEQLARPDNQGALSQLTSLISTNITEITSRLSDVGSTL